MLWSEWKDIQSDVSNEQFQEKTNFLTRSATILAALEKLDLSTKQNLVIHIVGADYKEGNSIEQTKEIFAFLIDNLNVQYVSKVSLVFIGPNLNARLHQMVFFNLYDPKKNTPRVDISYFSQIYEDFRLSSHFSQPDVAFCFNAGIWGYDSWCSTLQVMCNELKIPVVVTAYNMVEALEDQETLQKTCHFRWLWSPECNPFGSLVARQSKSLPNQNLADNSVWQCITCSFDSNENV